MTEVVDTPTAFGRPIRRKEDAKLLHGRTNWTDNIQLPGMLHLAMVRSPFAHAKINSIDTSAAASPTALSRRCSDSFTSSERACTLSETQLKLRSHSTRLPPNMERVFTKDP